MMDNYWKEFRIIAANKGRLLLCRYDNEEKAKAKEYKVVFIETNTVEIFTTSNYLEALGWFNAICEDEE